MGEVNKMRKLLFILTLISGIALGAAADTFQTPVPKDIFNTPIYGGLGMPQFDQSTTLTSTSWATVLTIDFTGVNIGRQFRHICVFNPSTTLEVRICFGAGCTTPQMVVPAGSSGAGLCIDHSYFGYLNSITLIRGSLSGGGSVNPQITVW